MKHSPVCSSHFSPNMMLRSVSPEAVLIGFTEVINPISSWLTNIDISIAKYIGV
jgi:hypothetical protein